MEGVVRLLGSTDVSWNAIRAFLGQPGSIKQIVNFDAGTVTLLIGTLCTNFSR